MSKKQITVTILCGMLTGGLSAASACFADNPALISIFASAAGLVGALGAFFGGK